MRVFVDVHEVGDMEEVTEPEEQHLTLAEYDAFIDPDGNFYGTKPSVLDYCRGSYNYHSDWAREYLRRANVTYGMSAKDHLVKTMGWVSVSVGYIREYGSGLELPDGRVTVGQAETLAGMWDAAGLDMDLLARKLEGKI